MEACSAQSGFLVATEVKQSQIPGAGRGRYVLEDINKDDIIRSTRIVRPTAARPGTTVVATTAGDLGVLTSRHSKSDAQPSAVEQLAAFGATPWDAVEGG